MENDVEKKFIAMKTDSERNVAKFLLNKGFTFVDSNAQIGESLNELLGEIDLLVTIKDYLFLVEVSKEKNSNEKKITFFTKWVDKDILDIIKNRYKLRTNKTVRIYFDLYTKKPKLNKSPLLQKLITIRKLNAIVYSDDYELLSKNVEKNETSTGNEFLNWLELSDTSKIKKIFNFFKIGSR